MIRDEELCPKEIWDKYGSLAITRWAHSGIRPTLELIRTFYGKPIYANTWIYGGDRNESTLRIPGHKTYRILDDHALWEAVDFIVDGIDSLQVQSDILKNTGLNGKLINLGVTGMEDSTVGWTHVSFTDLLGWNLDKKSGLYIIPK